MSYFVSSSLNLAYGGANNPPIPFAPLPLYDSAGNANHSQVAAYVALEGVTINIPDIYNTDDFDFSAAYSFDKVNQYRSLSCLTVSLKKMRLSAFTTDKRQITRGRAGDAFLGLPQTGNRIAGGAGGGGAAQSCAA
ncbi:MAG: hypothetical protein M5U34_41430 [Chloroflexi bacterium]|nr:hypothetical protein [Chloroflexota bacterium]